MPARTAILFVHGILGSPGFFDFLLPDVPQGVAVYSVTLAGHCATARDFGRASMKQWKRQVADAVRRLRSEFSRVIIVAHSMGTLFAIRQAAEGQADALLLLNPPLGLHLSVRLITNPVKVFLGRISPDDKWALAARRAYSIAPDANLLHYIAWPARYLELFAEIRRTRPLVKQISVPTAVFYSAHDEMVSARTARMFPPGAAIDFLPESGHYYYSPADEAKICSEFRSLLEKFGR